MLYFLDDIAKITRLKKRTLYNHISQGKLKVRKKTFKWGKKLSVVTEEDFKYYLDNYYFDQKKSKSARKCKPL